MGMHSKLKSRYQIKIMHTETNKTACPSEQSVYTKGCRICLYVYEPIYIYIYIYIYRFDLCRFTLYIVGICRFNFIVSF